MTVPVTEPQIQALLKLTKMKGCHLVSRMTKSVKLVNNQWEYTYKDFPKHTWAGYLDFTGEAYKIVTLSWDVVGELLNKGLVEISYDIKNQMLSIVLTKLGSLSLIEYRHEKAGILPELTVEVEEEE